MPWLKARATLSPSTMGAAAIAQFLKEEHFYEE
jgi:hypothetical protein